MRDPHVAIFLDTSFIVAFLNIKDSRNKAATNLWNKILDSQWGYPITSDYIVDECYTLLLARTQNLGLLTNLYSFIHGNPSQGIPKTIRFLHLPADLYDQTWELSNKYQDSQLSFTDLTTLAACHKHGIDYLASYDTDFDGKITRLT